jgi:hypothetical protein
MSENRTQAQLPETARLDIWQNIRKFLKSLTPLSNPNPELGQEIVDYLVYLNQIKPDLTPIQQGLIEVLNQTKNLIISCNFSPTSRRSQDITFYSNGKSNVIGNFSPAKIEFKTENQVFGVGSRIVTQNFSGEDNNKSEGIQDSMKLFSELASQNPSVIMMPATFDSKELKKHINDRGYHYIYTAITESSSPNKDIGNAIAIRSDVDISKLKIKLISSQRQVPHWVWEIDPDKAIKEIQPFVYHDVIVELNEEDALVLVYHSPFALASERMDDFLKLLENTSKFKRLLISGDFNTTGPAADVPDISMLTNYFGKGFKYSFPSGTWNFKLFNQMGGGAEQDIYSHLAKSLGLFYYKPSKPTLKIESAIGKLAYLVPDATITNLVIKNEFDKIPEKGSDHATNISTIVSDITLPIDSNNFDSKRKNYLKIAKTERQNAILTSQFFGSILTTVLFSSLGLGKVTINDNQNLTIKKVANPVTQVQPVKKQVK